MRDRGDLRLYEELMLLALNDAKGTVRFDGSHDLALGGGILAELVLLGQVEVQTQGKKQFARAVGGKPIGDPLLDECLQLIAQGKRRQQLKAWVARFSRLRQLRHRIARQLCRSGVLRESEDRILLVFRRRLYPEVDPAPERALLERMRRAIGGIDRPQPRTLDLIAVAHSAGLLRNVFAKQDLKASKSRLAEITGGSVAGIATRDAVKEAQAAVATVVVAAS